MSNSHTPSHAAGPAAPPPFAMPMYRDFVPRAVRPWIYVLLAFCFQFSNGVYLGAMNQMIGQNAWMREDVLMCLYATLIGMAIYFPVLFRMKFHFSNKFLLCASAAVIIGCNLLVLLPLPRPVVWAVCVVCGMAKIQGTFECMSNIQLWMTPKRDFAVFFPLLHIVLLTSMEFSAYLAAEFAFLYHWTLMHWFISGLMLFVLAVQCLLTRPFHAMPQIVPLKGIDWFGALLWTVLCLQVAYVLNYGDWLDWWHSAHLRLVCGTSLITLAVCLQRMWYHPQPYFEPAIWSYRHMVPIVLLIGVVEALFSCEHVLEMVYYEEVMHYADHVYERLNQWSLPGVWAGCLFSLGWLKLMRWNVYKLIAVGLCFFSLYAAGFYFQVDAALNIEALRLPLVFRGFSYAVLCISFMWALHAIMSFQHFFQALSIFNMLHMFVGGLIGAALHARGLNYYVGDGFARYGDWLTEVRLSRSPIDFAAFMEQFVENMLAQSVKTLFGWTLYGALFFALLMLLWDIPGVRSRVKRMQTWPRVGLQVMNGFRRQQRLHRLRARRREMQWRVTRKVKSF
ncbi:hypothetical protein MR642_09180 [bacterium]|nr:hypothetical protein [bacterium]